ncbi:hypothetical protein PVAND_010119 [Polypedilum vanderplanki]|uniref:Uncharacterized protein n=1 Tax=Polypedilum vanderplanki TaxID=319348 RepID=A0A9J6CEL6_POLVA|nr:hypothetical protein PVAND_010119 [Polypedilum vanderplanki]
MKLTILFITFFNIFTWINCETEKQYFVNIQVAPGFQVDRFSIEGHQDNQAPQQVPQVPQVPQVQNQNQGVLNNNVQAPQAPLIPTTLPETTILPTTIISIPELAVEAAAAANTKKKPEEPKKETGEKAAEPTDEEIQK